MINLANKLIFKMGNLVDSVKITQGGNDELFEDLVWMYCAERGLNPDTIEDMDTCILLMSEYDNSVNVGIRYSFAINLPTSRILKK